MIRKGFVSLALALKAAQTEANDIGDAVRVWRRTNKDGSQRFDVLDSDEAPKGDGWEMLQEFTPEPDDER